MVIMNLSEWFRDQLQASADGFVWSVEQVPNSRRYVEPPSGLGEWPAARHVFHMLYYEQTLALPSMRQWLGDARPSTDELNEEAAWAVEKAIGKDHLSGFIAVRAEQLALLLKLDDLAWHAERETIWGPQTLRWVVSKTYQHTAEHISDVLRIALFWDRFADLQKP
jgi:hypothetical protein